MGGARPAFGAPPKAFPRPTAAGAGFSGCGTSAEEEPGLAVPRSRPAFGGDALSGVDPRNLSCVRPLRRGQRSPYQFSQTDPFSIRSLSFPQQNDREVNEDLDPGGVGAASSLTRRWRACPAFPVSCDPNRPEPGHLPFYYQGVHLASYTSCPLTLPETAGILKGHSCMSYISLRNNCHQDNIWALYALQSPC